MSIKRIIFLILLITFTGSLIGCKKNEVIKVDDYSKSSISLNNSDSIYLDEVENNKVKLDFEIVDAPTKDVQYLIDQTGEFISIINGEIVIDNNVTDNYVFNITILLKAARYVYVTKDFVVKHTRGFIVGEKQVSQVVLTVNGNPMTSRGISWFTSSDVVESEVIISSEINFSNIKKFNGVKKEFQQYLDGESAKKNGEKMTFYNHQAVIDGLESGKTYYYKVGSSSLNVFSQVGSFKTMTDSESVKIFLTTDVHVGANEKTSPKSRYYHNAIEDAFDRYGNIDFAINTGDFVTQWSSGYTAFESEWIQAMKITPYFRKTTFVPISGNHDQKITLPTFDNSMNNHYSLPNSPALIDDDNIKGPNYEFEAGNVHITVLNYHDTSMITKGQKEWLNDILSKTTKKWKIVFSHMALPADVRAIIESHGVILAYSGHEHVYSRSNPLIGGEVQDIIRDSINENIFINQKGTSYVVNSTTGGADVWREYNPRKVDAYGFGLGSELDNLGKLQTKWGMYNVITIDQDQITVDLYIRNSTNALDDFKLHQTYGFKTS